MYKPGAKGFFGSLWLLWMDSVFLCSHRMRTILLSALVVPLPVCGEPLRDRSRKPGEGQAQMAELQPKPAACLTSGACRDVSISEAFEKQETTAGTREAEQIC